MHTPSPTETVKLTVVIATHGRQQLLQRTLQSLADCRLPAEFDRVLIVENGGKNGAEQLVRDAPAALHAEYRYVPQPNKSIALNMAVDEVATGLIVFLDDDVRLAEGFLEAYATASQGQAGKRFFGGPLEIDYEAELPEWLREHCPKSVTGWQLEGGDQEVKSPVFLGANWAAFANDIQQAGGFATHLGPALNAPVGEDSQMQQSLLENGLTGQYLEQAILWHYVPREVCTPQWVLQRTYRHTIRAGLEFEDHTPRLFGYPRWMYLEGLKKFATACWASITSNEQNAFPQKIDYIKFIAVARGIKQRYHLQS